jgi:hypothetical protein|tara:strand:+ start:2222 stop:2545 length:324 start_codon:yes stop_codon:yes gene_type:complete
MGILDIYNKKIAFNPGGTQTQPEVVSLSANPPLNPLAKPGQANSFKFTSLDLENPNPLGGPINVPYSTPVGTGVISSPTTQPYTPRRTYVDSLQDPLLIARSTDPIK